MRRPDPDISKIVASERPELLLFCGTLGLVGNIIPVLALFVAAALAQHDLIADTISDLARGPHKWVMDTAFYVNAVGLLALAISAAHFHLGRSGWSVGLLCLAFLALIVVMLGLWDDLRAGADNSFGMTVHTKLTFLLGPLYVAGPLLMARAAAAVSRFYGWFFRASAVLWAAFAVPYLLVPTSFDGLLEKVAFAATLLWTVPLAWLFLTRGYRCLHLDED